MKTEEDEAFDELARKQGMWGGGFPAKRAMAADKLQEPVLDLDGHVVRDVRKPKKAAALEALETERDIYREHDEDGAPEYILDAITSIKAALAQPAQEPVACVQDLDEVKRKHLVYEKGMGWKDPLYTTPPQREWVGLTEQEQGAIMEDLNAHGTRLYEFARAIEAKLKEKNNGT
jgi:hypothetical protein